MDCALTVEEQLCVLLGRKDLLPPARERALSLLAQPLDWDALLVHAREEGIYPLIYWNLKVLGFPGASGKARTGLESLFRGNAARNSLLAGELLRVVETLERKDIPVLCLKGLPLAESLYGDVNLRTSADIDILVPRPYLARAFHLLAAQGYEASFPSWFLTDCLLQSNFEFPVHRTVRVISYIVELHCGLFWNCLAEGETARDLWAGKRAVTLQGASVSCLSPEWEALFLVTHAARHDWRGIKWLADLHAVCLHPNLDWNRIELTARRFGWELFVSRALGTCQALFGTILPAGISSQPPNRPLQSFFMRANPATPLQATLSCVRLLPRLSNRLRLFVSRLFLPTVADADRIRLPAAWGFLYYILRPFRLSFKTARSLARNLWPAR